MLEGSLIVGKLVDRSSYTIQWAILNWQSQGDEMWGVCAKLHYWPTYAYDGRLILNEKRPQVEFGHKSYNVGRPAAFYCRRSMSCQGHRGELHAILWQHVLDQGIDIRCNSKVSEVSSWSRDRRAWLIVKQYWETETESGVICNGERLHADMVVGADGV